MTSKFAKRKFNYYLNNEVIDTTDHEKLVSLLTGYVNAHDIENAKPIADTLLLNDYLDSRADKVPVGTVYSKAETPILSLKFAYALENLYYQSGILSYHTEAQSIIDRLNTNLTLDKTAGLTTFIQLYSEDDSPLGSFRGGTYISDLMPAVWTMFGFSGNSTEAVSYYRLAQKDFEIKSGRLSIFSPVYLRNFPENSIYGTLGTFVVEGNLGNETDFIHQYKSILDLCTYYYEKYKATGNKDKLAKTTINIFFEWLFSRGDVPTEMTYTGLYADNEDIYADNLDIYADQEAIFTISTSGYNQDFNIMVALSCLYKFKVDKEQAYYNYAENVVALLLASQASNGSFAFTYSGTAGYANSLLHFYNNIQEQSYFDTVNDSLKLFKLDKISEINKDSHPQKIVLTFCKQGIDQILLKRFFEHTYTETSLTYSDGINQYSLSDLGINPHRIDQIYFYENGTLCELKEISYLHYLEYVNKNNTEKSPEWFCRKGDILYLHNTPDKDYSIKISHYKVEGAEVNYSKVPELLPQKWYHVLKWFISHRLALHRDDKRAEIFETLYRRALAGMEYSDSIDLSETSLRASNMRFN